MCNVLLLPSSNDVVVISGCKYQSTVVQGYLVGRDHVGRPVGFHVEVLYDAPSGPALDGVRPDATLHTFPYLEAKGRSGWPGGLLACRLEEEYME